MKKKQKTRLFLNRETLGTLTYVRGGEPLTDGSCGVTACKNTDYCPTRLGASCTCPP